MHVPRRTGWGGEAEDGRRAQNYRHAVRHERVVGRVGRRVGEVVGVVQHDHAAQAVLERQQEFAEAPSGNELADSVCVDTSVAVDPLEVAASLRGPASGRAAGCGP